MIGLCVVAACALAAIGGASTASATAKFGVCVAAKKAVYADSNCKEPAMKKGVPAPTKGKFEFEGAGECYPTKHGNYADNVCSKLAEKKGAPAPGKGKFEKAPLPTAEVTGAEAKLKSAAGTIKCASSKGTQTITSPTSLDSITTFKTCEGAGNKCTSAGKAEGEITTYELDGVLVEPKPGTASINITGDGSDGFGSAEEGKLLAEFSCVVVGVRVSAGPLGGALSPVNVMGTTETTTFEELVEQGLKAEFGAPPAFGGAPISSEQIGSVTATNPVPFEVHAP